MIPPGVDLARIEPAPPSDRARPLIVHAPSSPAPQGHGARDRGRAKGSTPTSSSSRGSTTTRRSSATARADIVVDQLNAGWYGLFAIEAMALGKPVVTFLHDEAVRRTEEAFGIRVPIVSATEETLREALRPLVADAARRRELGAARAPTSSACTTSSASPTACSTLYARPLDDARGADAAAREALGGLRARRDRLARDRGLPAAASTRATSTRRTSAPSACSSRSRPCS